MWPPPVRGPGGQRLEPHLATALEAGDSSSPHVPPTKTETLPSLTVLSGSFAHLNGPDAEAAYAVSALAAGRLLEAAGGVAVANVLRDLNDGLAIEQAFDRRMPWSFADFVAGVVQ